MSHRGLWNYKLSKLVCSERHEDNMTSQVLIGEYFLAVRIQIYVYINTRWLMVESRLDVYFQNDPTSGLP